MPEVVAGMEEESFDCLDVELPCFGGPRRRALSTDNDWIIIFVKIVVIQLFDIVHKKYEKQAT